MLKLLNLAPFGSDPVVIDNQSLSEGFDEILEARIESLRSTEKNDYEKCLLYSTIELLNNLRSDKYHHFISAVTSIEGGRFLLYIAPNKKKLLGCIFNANKKYRPDIFEPTNQNNVPEIIAQPLKPVVSFKELGKITLVATFLLIIFWPNISWQVSRYLDKPCVNHLMEERFHDAYVVCSERMKKGSRNAMYFVGKLYQDGKGIETNYAKSEELYRQLTRKEDVASSLANMGLGDLYKT